MTENINDTEQLSIDAVASPRSKLIYDYTEKLCKAKNDNIDTLNTRLGLLLGASATLLKFVFDLKTECLYIKQFQCYSCIGLQLLSIVCTAISIYFCLEGLNSKGTGKYILPSELMKDEWYEAIEEKTRAFIINTWIQTIEEFTASATEKSSFIRKSLRCLTFALLLFGIDSLLILLLNNKIL
ncbi:MAG: hypothetical protein RLZZ139_4136 [Cyanobacteriota bacterium]|jgi:hypothetical protein